MSRFYCEVLVKHIPAPFVCTLTREVLVQLMLDSAKVSSEVITFASVDIMNQEVNIIGSKTESKIRDKFIFPPIFLLVLYIPSK